MEAEIEKTVVELLGHNVNDYWKDKIVNSILSIAMLFNIKVSSDMIYREWIKPEDLWVVDEDELDFNNAHECIKKYGNSNPNPITVIRCQNENLLFMGSTRSLIFAMTTKKIDCIVIESNDIVNSNFYNSKTKKLSSYIQHKYEEVGEYLYSVEEYYNNNLHNEVNRLNMFSPEYLITCDYLNEYLHKDEVIIDIGCGPGKYTYFLLEKGLHVSIADISSKSVEYTIKGAQEKGFEVDEAYVADATKISSLTNTKYDGVLCMGPMYHTESDEKRRKILESCMELLKANGIFVATFLSTYAKFNNYVSKLIRVYESKGIEGVDLKINEIIKHIDIIQSSDTTFIEKKDSLEVETVYTNIACLKEYMESFGLKTLRLCPLEGLLDESYTHDFYGLSEDVKNRLIKLNKHICMMEYLQGVGGHIIYIGQKVIV